MSLYQRLLVITTIGSALLTFAIMQLGTNSAPSVHLPPAKAIETTTSPQPIAPAMPDLPKKSGTMTLVWHPQQGIYVNQVAIPQSDTGI
ncbi:hypothetical protein [Methylophaga sp. OBS3]|uniref:hypothetical protein n=1 Tax=Methylophaga sp. OBS3 TaxID=2991934 RepID=UPI00224E9385|nr:hypothetical protein [Methylophaga sp. OBS3]MCX4190384.1 hypothetical protein [Methylophaga sp. OBS3]